MWQWLNWYSMQHKVKPLHSCTPKYRLMKWANKTAGWHLLSCNRSITSLQPSKLHLNISYVPPTDTGLLCLAVDSTHMAVGLFWLLVWRSGTHCQMNSEIRRVMSTTASNSSLKQSCSALTSVTSALEVILNVMRSINPRFTYLLTLLTNPAHQGDRRQTSLAWHGRQRCQRRYGTLRRRRRPV